MENVHEAISRRRRQCIIHRIIYYVLNDNLIPDQTYDKWERELRELCHEYPDIAMEVPYFWLCPSHKVGSSNANEYPSNLVAIAKGLLRYRDIQEGKIKEPEIIIPKEQPKPKKPQKQESKIISKTLFAIPGLLKK